MWTQAVVAVPSTVTQVRRVAQYTLCQKQTFELQKKMLYLLACCLDNRVLVQILITGGGLRFGFHYAVLHVFALICWALIREHL